MPAKVTFEFRDSSLFRIVHADGVFGGPSPSGDIYLSFYNEHAPMPTRVTHELDGSGLGKEVVEDRVSDACIVRTNEVGIVMNFAAAVNLREWLTRRVKDMIALDSKFSEIEAATVKLADAKLLTKA